MPGDSSVPASVTVTGEENPPVQSGWSGLSATEVVGGVTSLFVNVTSTRCVASVYLKRTTLPAATVSGMSAPSRTPPAP